LPRLEKPAWLSEFSFGIKETYWNQGNLQR
jgi:hypothetical protein